MSLAPPALAALFASFAVAASPAPAAPITRTAVKDTYVDSANRSANFGAATTADITTSTNHATGTSQTTFVSFNVAGVGQVAAAELAIQKVSGRGDRTVALWGVTDESFDAFDETALTWDGGVAAGVLRDGTGASLVNEVRVGNVGTTEPRNDGAIVYTRSAVSVATANALVDFINADTNGIVTFALHQDQGNANLFRFATRENTTSGYIAPTLVLTAVPEPTSLTGLALAGALLLHRRRHRLSR